MVAAFLECSTTQIPLEIPSYVMTRLNHPTIVASNKLTLRLTCPSHFSTPDSALACLLKLTIRVFKWLGLF